MYFDEKIGKIIMRGGSERYGPVRNIQIFHAFPNIYASQKQFIFLLKLKKGRLKKVFYRPRFITRKYAGSSRKKIKKVENMHKF